MSRILLTIMIACSLAGAGCAQSITYRNPMRRTLVAGHAYTIRWSSFGVRNVSIYATGEKTLLGGRSRGRFSIPIKTAVPASDGKVVWNTPWIDSLHFAIEIRGFDPRGRRLTVARRDYDFRPKALANRFVDGIYLDLHLRKDQRLYVQKDRRLIHAYLSSSSENWEWKPRNVHPDKMHDHGGVFKVLSKERNHYSTLFRVDMPYAMRYHGGHYIHATSPNLYDSLGEPASNGCNRLTMEDARALYVSTPIGTRVEVIGPEGA